MLEQDLKLLLRNAIFWVIAATLVLIVLTVNFLIPEDFSPSDPTLALYGLESSVSGAEVLESPAAVEALVRERGAVGVVKQAGELTLIHTGLSEQAAAALVAQLSPPQEPLAAIATTVLRPGTGTIPENLRLTPIAIAFEALVLGFLMAAVLMLAEKQEQVLKAYRISPGGTLTYVTSKTLLFTGMGALYAVLMAVTTVGVDFDWLNFILLSVLASALYTLLGLSVALFFKDISDWFPIATVILSINMLPMASYAVPNFAPTWLTVIPSYNILFAYEAILFGTGKGIAGTHLLLAAEIVAAVALCTALVKQRLLSAH